MSSDDDGEISDEEAGLSRKAIQKHESVVQVAEYMVLQELGTGAQGTVYKAQNRLTQEIHAIKELVNLEDGITEQARTEIAVMKRLAHPNVAKFIAAYDTPDNPSTLFLVLEYVSGGGLFTDKEVWTGGVDPLPLERAQDIFQQLIRGISYLHHMGVMHRDIKPSNVLGNRLRGNVKVSDFGVSSFTKRQKSARLLGEDDIIFVGSCGTPAFLAPEASGASIDHYYHARPADVWALGVTFYFLVQGSLPFKGENRMDTARLICDAPVRFISKLPSPARDLLTKMLEKDPVKRPPLYTVQSHPWIGLASWKVETESQVLGKVSAREFMNSVSSTRNIVRRRRSFRMIAGAMATRFRRSISTSSYRSNNSLADDPPLSKHDSESLLTLEEHRTLPSAPQNGEFVEETSTIESSAATKTSVGSTVLEEGLGKRLFLQCVVSL